MTTPITIHAAWICPDLSNHWKVVRDRTTHQCFLKAKGISLCHLISEIEGFALTHFIGRYSVQQIQQICSQQFSGIPEDTVIQLLLRLVNIGILSLETETNQRDSTASQKLFEPRLKACVHWIQTEDGHWILRNPEDITFVQLNEVGKQVVESLGTVRTQAIVKEYNLSSAELRSLLQQLTFAAMLEGTKPPTPRRKKFTPMQLLFFKLPLWNPDQWLMNHIKPLRWIWTREFWWSLCAVLAGTAAIALHQQAELVWTAQTFLSRLNFEVTATFVFLALLVVLLHELGHAFTLKHYGGVVPEVGVMLMCFMPIAYTNTTDQYSLPKRSQRMLVVGAGVLCQLIIATISFWLWNSSAMGSSLWVFSYLLFTASIFTVAINLNPLAKFDGYYLAVAMTGINNLRQRSFAFYRDLLTLKPSLEQGNDRWILAAYAPLSLLYSLFVFGFLILQVADWTLTHIPFTALVLLAIWAIYFYLMPEVKS